MMERLNIYAAVCLSLILSASNPSQAAKAPASPERLHSWASHVVIATVEGIEVGVSSAHFDAGWCNSDWLISIRLAAEEVEKGSDIQPGDELVIRAFQPRTRRSIMESFAPGSHSPIPARGERVRAYVRADGGHYQVYLPNGFAPPGNYDEEEFWKRQGSMPQAIETRGLRTWWPFIIPIELWVLIALIGLPVVAACGWLLSRHVKHRGARLTAATTVTVWAILLLTAFVICVDIFHEYGRVALLGGPLVLAAYATLATRMFAGIGNPPAWLVALGLALVGALAAFFAAKRLTPDAHFLLGNSSLDQGLRLVRMLVLPASGALAGWLLACLAAACSPPKATSQTEHP